jgi:hypothetical protein
MHKKVEDLGLDGDQSISPAKFAAVRVESTVVEQIVQGLASTGA